MDTGGLCCHRALWQQVFETIRRLRSALRKPRGRAGAQGTLGHVSVSRGAAARLGASPPPATLLQSVASPDRFPARAGPGHRLVGSGAGSTGWVTRVLGGPIRRLQQVVADRNEHSNTREGVRLGLGDWAVTGRGPSSPTMMARNIDIIAGRLTEFASCHKVGTTDLQEEPTTAESQPVERIP